MSHSTVLRRLQSMEDRLGVKIFERRREGLRATAAGEEMAEIGARFEEDVDGLERRLVGRDLRPSGCIRVTTADTLATHLLGPILAEFGSAYPTIEVELVTSNTFLNLTKRDADIAVRPTAKPHETLIGRRMGPVMTAVYGASGYLEREGRDYGQPHHAWCGFDDSMSHTDIGRTQKSFLKDRVPRLRANTVMGILTFALGGAGLAILPCFVGDQEPRLERVSEPFDRSGVELWLLTHRDLKTTTRVQVFLEFAGKAIKQRRHLLEGRSAPRAV